MNILQNRFRYVIVGLLFFITLLNYIDRASMSYAIDDITAEYHFSNTLVGLILGAFGAGYVFTTFLGGVAADSFGAKRTLACAMLFWGVCTFLTGAANGFLMLMTSRVLLGLAEGPSFPCIARAIGDWLPEKERNYAISCTLISVPVALAIGGPILAKLISFFGWRNTYFILSAIPLIWLPIWWYFFYDNPAKSPYVSKKELVHITQKETIKTKLNRNKSIWAVLFFNKTLLANNFSFFVLGFYLFFFMTWLPRYFSSTYNLDLNSIGIYSIFPWLTAAVMMWVTGVIADKIFVKTACLRLSRTYPIFISQILAALCIIPIRYISNLDIVVIFLSLAIGFIMSTNACYYSVNIDIARKRAATSLGIMNVCLAVSGFISPVLAGLFVSWFGNFDSVFILLSGLSITSAIITFLFHNR